MKIDTFYYCFGCGATGDSIDYTARLFGLSQIEAARKLCMDFHLGAMVGETRPDPKARVKEQLFRERCADKERVLNQFRRWTRICIEKLKTCEYMLEEMFERCCPQHANGYQFTDAFEFACMKRDIVGYWLDILCLGSEEERCEFFLQQGKGVNSFAETVERYAGRALGPNVGSA